MESAGSAIRSMYGELARAIVEGSAERLGDLVGDDFTKVNLDGTTYARDEWISRIEPVTYRDADCYVDKLSVEDDQAAVYVTKRLISEAGAKEVHSVVQSRDVLKNTDSSWRLIESETFKLDRLEHDARGAVRSWRGAGDAVPVEELVTTKALEQYSDLRLKRNVRRLAGPLGGLR